MQKYHASSCLETFRHFTVNYCCRMIHGFTRTGLTETQYINYCQASHIGNVEEKYISTGKPYSARLSAKNVWLTKAKGP